MKKVLFALVLVSSLGSLAHATQANINCVSDKEVINLTVLIDHGQAYLAKMEVISAFLYSKQDGQSSGEMDSRPTPANGYYWYESTDRYNLYTYGFYLPNNLIFSSQKRVGIDMYFGPSNHPRSTTFRATCDSEFER